MVVAVTFSQKELRLVLDAIHARIEAEVARYQITPPSEDAEGDYGNDLHNLRLQRDALLKLAQQGEGTAKVYECWHDPDEGCITLTQFQYVADLRARGLLGSNATLLYSVTAHTGEEAMAIHNLRQGWAPYLPTGEAAPCPKCDTPYYPMGYGDCWRCGHIG